MFINIYVTPTDHEVLLNELVVLCTDGRWALDMTNLDTLYRVDLTWDGPPRMSYVTVYGLRVRCMCRVWKIWHVEQNRWIRLDLQFNHHPDVGTQIVHLGQVNSGVYQSLLTVVHKLNRYELCELFDAYRLPSRKDVQSMPAFNLGDLTFRDINLEVH